MRIPLVSVIIPLHNAEAYFSECIESVINQTYPNIEVIVVENGSTDNSLQVAKQYASDYVHIYVSGIANVSAARNLGIHHAKGTYLLFLDADDKLEKTKIGKQINALEKYDFNPLMVSCSSLYAFSGSRSYVANEIKDYYSPAIDFMIDMFSTGSSWNCSCYLVHKDLVKRIVPWDEKLVRAEDWLWFAQALDVAESVIFVPESISYYRTDNIHSLSKCLNERAIASEFRARTKVVRIISKCQSPLKYGVIVKLIMGWNKSIYPYYRKNRKKAERLLKKIVPDCKIEYPKITMKEKLYYIGVWLHLVRSNMRP